MMFALFDQEHTKIELMTVAKHYKIGLKNLCFSTWLFWRWIMYGFIISAFVFFISFFTFNWSPSILNGNDGDLWLEGVFAYGSVVIIANTTILYGSSSHTIPSILIILVSVASFFGVFYMFSTLGISTLSNEF